VTTLDAASQPVPEQSDAATEPSRPQPVNAHRALTAHQARIVFGVLALVVCVDQGFKAWAWQHLPDTHINSGADMLVSSVVGSWYRDPLLGAVLDVVGALVLTLVGLLLVRRGRSTPVLLGAAITLAGWASYLADRLGMHHLTAPGSVRGAVDFVKWQGRTWNMADLAIGCGSALLMVCAVLAALRRAGAWCTAATAPPGKRGGRRRIADWQQRAARRVLLTSLALASVFALTDLLIGPGRFSQRWLG
jgi:lipoprotein signal peptidase